MSKRYATLARMCVRRYPVIPGDLQMDVFQLLDYAGVAVFAATGALAASRKRLDVIGFLFLASMTGIGGGTLRDLILGLTPVFWVKDPVILLVCAATALVMYFAAQWVEHRFTLLLWLDAAGLAAYAVLGAQIGLAAGVENIIAIVTGVMTATFGGIIRDVVSHEPTVLLRQEIYITAALSGATIHVTLSYFDVPAAISAAIAVTFAFALRGGAMMFCWTLPAYRRD
ncbi:MAG: trimeric intracellular cation channel family protein [Pseudomonadales bacterium]|nr:trimeric intracellular cation channel family protein [Pseudomonadales bacterium]